MVFVVVWREEDGGSHGLKRNCGVTERVIIGGDKVVWVEGTELYSVVIATVTMPANEWGWR